MSIIVARINEYEIKEEEYRHELECLLKNLKLEQANLESKYQAINQLIEGYLLLSVSRKSGIAIEQEEIDHALVDIMLQYDSEDDYLSMLDKNLLTESIIIQRIIDSIYIKKYITTNFLINEDISDDLLKEVYEENLDCFKVKESIRASHILIKGNSTASLVRAKEIRDSIKDKNDFLTYAKGCSDCPSFCQFGELGIITRGVMIKEFEEVAFNLKIDEISQPVLTPFGFHIILVTEKRQSSLADFDHIKDSLKKRVQQIEGELRLKKHLKELKALATIVIYDELL